MRELREDTFLGNKNDDAYEHVERLLDIVSFFNIPRVTHDAVMLLVFPITLTGAASFKEMARRVNQQGLSNDSSDGIAAITSKSDNLGRDIKKLKENVHDIQVGCENYRGAHLNKEYSLHEEVKNVKEVKYGKFGQSFLNNERNGARYFVGPPRYYHVLIIAHLSCKAIFANNKAPTDEASSKGTNDLHEVSFISDDNDKVFKETKEGLRGVLPC
uniref:Uncharacterized protein n=1 Tax=Tanacetum cinerariifolium TaxID=118510 RepID=A0A6L2ME52_TANCI|nr:hypothetical protein [Tanacetum cinerariifolium]